MAFRHELGDRTWDAVPADPIGGLRHLSVARMMRAGSRLHKPHGGYPRRASAASWAKMFRTTRPFRLLNKKGQRGF